MIIPLFYEKGRMTELMAAKSTRVRGLFCFCLVFFALILAPVAMAEEKRGNPAVHTLLGSLGWTTWGEAARRR
jgi:hypothetical protein